MCGDGMCVFPGEPVFPGAQFRFKWRNGAIPGAINMKDTERQNEYRVLAC